MTQILGLECHSEQEVVFKMSGFGIVYTLGMAQTNFCLPKFIVILFQVIKLPNFINPFISIFTLVEIFSSLFCTPHHVPNCLFGWLWVIRL